jgi:hypothetical protein
MSATIRATLAYISVSKPFLPFVIMIRIPYSILLVGFILSGADYRAANNYSETPGVLMANLGLEKDWLGAMLHCNLQLDRSEAG